MDLYHGDIGLPPGFKLPARRVDLFWTNHAKQACKNDRYGDIPEFASIPLQVFKTVEVGVQAGRVVKVVVRGHYTPTLDVVLVLIPNLDKPWTVKTVWINQRNDSHKTLDRTKYVC